MLSALLLLTVSIAPYDFAGQRVERVAVWTKVDAGTWVKSQTPLLPGQTSIGVNRNAVCGQTVQAKARAERADAEPTGTRYSEIVFSPLHVLPCVTGPDAPVELRIGK